MEKEEARKKKKEGKLEKQSTNRKRECGGAIVRLRGIEEERKHGKGGQE